MKNFLIAVLIVGAIGYYFDISPTDFLPRLPSNAPARERQASAASAQAPAARPQPTETSTPSSHAADGSLASRWQSSGSPAKP
jgi:hypothetical protein